MKTIHSYWRQWLHIDTLINKRKHTLVNIQGMKGKELEKTLQREFPDEYPSTFESFIVLPFFDEVKDSIDAKALVMQQNEISFTICFHDEHDLEIATVSLEVNLDPDNGTSIFSVKKGDVLVSVCDDFNAHDFFSFLNIH